MLFLSCVTVSSGSTGGGIKMIRTLILARQALSRAEAPDPSGHRRAGAASATPSFRSNIAGAVLGFIFLYILTVGELTFFLIASGLDFISSFTAIIACINNAGPGLNVVGPAQNYQALTDFQTWVCSFAMLIGRLEVMSVFVLFTPAFWRSRRLATITLAQLMRFRRTGSSDHDPSRATTPSCARCCASRPSTRPSG